MKFSTKYTLIIIFTFLILIGNTALLFRNYSRATRELDSLEKTNALFGTLVHVHYNIGSSANELMDFVLGEKEAEADYQNHIKTSEAFLKNMISIADIEEKELMEQMSQKLDEYKNTIKLLKETPDKEKIGEMVRFKVKPALDDMNRLTSEIYRKNTSMIENKNYSLLLHTDVVMSSPDIILGEVEKARLASGYFQAVDIMMDDINLMVLAILEYIYRPEEPQREYILELKDKVMADFEGVSAIIRMQQEAGEAGEDEDQARLIQMMDIFNDITISIDIMFTHIIYDDNPQASFEYKVKRFEPLIKDGLMNLVNDILEDATEELESSHERLEKDILGNFRILFIIHGVLLFLILAVLFIPVRKHEVGTF